MVFNIRVVPVFMVKLPDVFIFSRLTYFQLRNDYHQNYCVDNLNNDSKGAGLPIGTYPCHPSDGAIDNQVYLENSRKRFLRIFEVNCASIFDIASNILPKLRLLCYTALHLNLI